MSPSTYLVTQATGEQAKWTITHLLTAGAKVHAVVRDLSKAPALLHQPGVTLFQGESKNFDDIYKAAQGCKGAYLNTFPIPGLEALQAKTIVEACEKAGVQSIVACTTFLTNRRNVWDNQATIDCLLDGYFNSKAEVEAIVRSASVSAYTILRPAILYQDFYLPGAYGNYPKLPEGVLDHAFSDGFKGAFTDAHDVGRYAASALLDPSRFAKQEIDLANAALTMEEAHHLLEKVSGRSIKLHKRSPEEVEEAKATVFGQCFQLWPNFQALEGIETSAQSNETKYGISTTGLEDVLVRDKERLMYLPA